MRRRFFFPTLLLILFLAPARGQDWTPLFNGQNLDGWYTWLPSTGVNNDPRQVFKVQNGLLHILDIPVTGQDQEFGYVATASEYDNYRLRFDYRWGTKRFPPRANEKRDTGLLYHTVGPDRLWPRSVECQVQEGDTGDLWMLSGTFLTTTVEDPGVSPRKYQERGETYTTQNDDYENVVKSGTHDSLANWNTVEVIAAGDEAVHIVNGVVNNRGTKIRQPDPNNPALRTPLRRGRILFQAEGAEVFYRNIEIKPLHFPAPRADAVVLFDGINTSLWKPKNSAEPVPIPWIVEDGALEVVPGSGDIQTLARFRDFRLHVEFKTPVSDPNANEQARGNSGVYLQGRYEIQVLDSWGRALEGADDCGAVYGIKNADNNAALPAEAWQSYDIVFRAARWDGNTKVANARVTVYHNGTLIHDAVEIPTSTLLGEPEGPEPGPILLQDHGESRVRFRNLWIEPLPRRALEVPSSF